MKRTKEEILAALNGNAEALGDNLIGLLEDISDSMVDAPDMSDYVAKSDYDAVVAERDDIKGKYIARFVGPAEDTKLEIKDETKEEPEPEITLDEILADYT